MEMGTGEREILTFPEISLWGGGRKWSLRGQGGCISLADARVCLCVDVH